MLQHTTVCYSTLQYAAVYYSTDLLDVHHELIAHNPSSRVQVVSEVTDVQDHVSILLRNEALMRRINRVGVTKEGRKRRINRVGVTKEGRKS
jgi:hypothetical protein